MYPAHICEKYMHNPRSAPNIVIGTLGITEVSTSYILVTSRGKGMDLDPKFFMDSTPPEASGSASQTELPQKPGIATNKEQTLQTIDEAVPQKPALPLAEKPKTSTIAIEPIQHQITSFLKRPVILQQGKINPSMNTGSFVFNMEFPTAILEHPMIHPKIQGFRFIRGTISVRFQHNAQPFQQGLFRMAYFPMLSPIREWDSQLDSFRRFSGLNGVDINFSNNNPIVLKIPFIYPTPSYDMILSTDAWAYLQMQCYLPLRSNGTADVSYTVYAHFDDVEVSMPTSQRPSLPPNNNCLTQPRKVIPAILQSNFEEIELGSPRIIQMKDFWYVLFFSFFAYLYSKLFRRRSNAIVVQAGVEEKATTSGSLEKIVSAVDSIVTIAEGIPLLSSIARPIVDSFSNIVSLATSFGWSKPSSDKIFQKFRYRMVDNMNNADGVELTSNMALFTDNRVNVALPQYGVNYDEMAIQSIVKIPQYIDKFSISTSIEENNRLWYAEIDPMKLTCTRNTTTRRVDTTLLGYVCAAFEVWRGGLRFTFKVAKTRFHSARVMIVWYNTEEPPSTKFNCSTAYNYQILWDLSESYETQVVVPYIQSVEWLGLHSDYGSHKRSNGYIAMYLINQLRAASGVVSNTIDVAVEVAGCPDFSIQIPRDPRIDGYTVRPITSNLENSSPIRAMRNGDYVAARTDTVYIELLDKLYPVGVGTGYLTPMPIGMYYNQQTSPTNFEWRKVDSIQTILAWDDSQRAYGLEIRVGTDFRITPSNTIYLSRPHVLTLIAADYGLMAFRLEYVQNRKLTIKDHKHEAIAKIEQKLEDVSKKIDDDLKVHSNLLSSLKIDLDVVGKIALIVHAINVRQMKLIYNDEFFTVEDDSSIEFDVPTGFEVTYKGTTTNVGLYGKIKIVYFGSKIVGKNKFNFILYHGKDMLDFVSFTLTSSDMPFLIAKNVFTASLQGRQDALIDQSRENITGLTRLNVDPHFRTIGENIRSIRALLKRYGHFTSIDSEPGDTFGIFKSEALFDPYLMTSGTQVVSTSNIGSTDNISYFAPLFRFFSGEMRFKVFVQNEHGEVYNGIIYVVHFPNYNSFTPPTTSETVLSTVAYNITQEGCIEFTIPFYNKNYMIVNGSIQETELLSPLNTRVGLFTTNANKLKYLVFRAFGEFSTFGALLSSAELVYNET